MSDKDKTLRLTHVSAGQVSDYGFRLSVVFGTGKTTHGREIILEIGASPEQVANELAELACAINRDAGP